MVILYKEPTIAEQFRCKRNMIEKLYLFMIYTVFIKVRLSNHEISQATQLYLTSDDFGQFANLMITTMSLLLPDLHSLIQRYDVLSVISIVFQRLDQWLS